MNIDTTETHNTTETAIGFIPCYNQPFFKVCSKCGLEKSNEDYSQYFYKPKKDGTKKTGIRTYCNTCKNNMTKDWFKINKEYKKEYRKNKPEKLKEENLRAKKRIKEWATKNAEILKEKKKNYKLNNIEIVRESNKRLEKKWAEELTDTYVVNQILKRSNLKAEQIRCNPELIEIKRIIIKTKRLCKTLTI